MSIYTKYLSLLFLLPMSLLAQSQTTLTTQYIMGEEKVITRICAVSNNIYTVRYSYNPNGFATQPLTYPLGKLHYMAYIMVCDSSGEPISKGWSGQVIPDGGCSEDVPEDMVRKAFIQKEKEDKEPRLTVYIENSNACKPMENTATGKAIENISNGTISSAEPPESLSIEEFKKYIMGRIVELRKENFEMLLTIKDLQARVKQLEEKGSNNTWRVPAQSITNVHRVLIYSPVTNVYFTNITFSPVYRGIEHRDKE